MKKYQAIVYLLFLILTSCGTDPMKDFALEPNDGRFDRYRAYFEKHTDHDTSYIPIYYGKNSAIASCGFTVVDGRWNFKHITVNRGRFEELTAMWRFAVIAHELIHCHLELNHVPNERGRLVLMAETLDISWDLSSDELIEALQEYAR